MEVKTTETFDDWLEHLKNKQAVSKINIRIRNVQKYGHFGDHKSVGEGVSEMRIHGGAGYRLYYTLRGDTVVFLLCGGDKSEQQRNIEQAQQLAKDL